MRIRKIKKALFGSLAALVLAVGLSCKSNPNQPKIAAKLLSDNRAWINPAILNSLDTTKTLLCPSDINEWLSLFEEEPEYQGLEPASRCSLLRVIDGYETQIPVAGMEFTIGQFENGHRKWAQYGDLDWEGIVTSRGGRKKCLKLPKSGYPAKTYDSMIKLDSISNSTYLILATDLLPVDHDQLTEDWRLVGDWNEWNYETGLSPISFTPKEIKFDVSSIHGKVNVKAKSKINTWIWGRFGHLGSGELDGYRHPLIKMNPDGSAAIFLP